MKKHSGIMVPLLSPFLEDGTTDLPHLEKLLDFITSHNCQPFVLGTTGEGASIRPAEQRKIVRAAVKYRKEGIKVYACVTGTCLEEVAARAGEFADLGVDAVAAPLPFYYPLSGGEMTRWYETLADRSPCPLLLYNIPSTTHMSIPLEVADRLSGHPNIEGIKDSEKDEARLAGSLRLWKDREDFCHLMGWAGRCREALEQGSAGLVPSSANLVPAVYEQLYRAVLEGDQSGAAEMQRLSDEIGKVYQEGRLLGGSLAALKVLGAARGLCMPVVLPPLQPLGEEEAAALRDRFAPFSSL